MTAAGNPLLTVADVARLLNTSKNTIYSWVAAERIPHLRLERLLRFDPEVLASWLEAKAR